jgi:two-component system, OmpR family, response regulator
LLDIFRHGSRTKDLQRCNLSRVLIVDDVEIVRKALQVGVQKLGHEAEGASDPLVALELARLHPPDLALVDYRMPGMDGVAFFGELKSQLGDRCPKVLFVSATPPEEVREKLLPTGLVPEGFVRKPFHLDDLWKTVKDALAH